jgi:large subunit ribosomal protein L13
MIIYDAENQILGRLSTVIAKELLKGENVFVVNSEKAVICGNPKYIQQKYYKKIKRGSALHGPHFPKQPDDIFRRTVRNMLPWDRTRGRNAYRNLKVFVGVPEELKNKEFKQVKEASASKLKIKYTVLGDLSVALGAKKRW